MKGWAKRINWLWAAGGFTLVYLAGAAFIVGPIRAWSFVTTGDLNEVGDFLAGVFSPLAFIWLVAAVLTQRQELDETREQFAASQAVIDGQMKNIAAQNLISALQYEKAQEAAKQTYKLNLFDKRFDIFTELAAIPREFIRYGINLDTVRALYDLHNRSTFVFNSEVEDFIQGLADLVDRYLQLQNTAMVEDDFGNLVVSESPEFAETRRDLDQILAHLVLAMSVDELRNKMWKSLRVSDD